MQNGNKHSNPSNIKAVYVDMIDMTLKRVDCVYMLKNDG